MSGPVAAPASTPQAPPSPPSSLVRSGLRDYTDWVGLPEIFAVWADKAEWKNGKTRFSYWHPVMKNYSYFFEAIRVAGGYRFKEIAEPNDPKGYWDESLGGDCPIRFYYTFHDFPPLPVRPRIEPGPLRNDRTKVELDIARPKAPVPEATGAPQAPAPKP